MKFDSSIYNVGYPVYGAKFLNNSMLLVAGGGGEGNNGIPNKLTVLRVNFDKKKIVKRFREITLDPNDDSPTTLDVANSVILMGCNENTEKIKSGEGNHHLRKFVYENDHLRFIASIDLDGSKTPEDYTKLVYLSKDGSVGAIASSKLPTVIRIIDPRDLTEKYEIETGHDVKDMHFAPDGKVIGYITATTLEIISIVTGRFIIRKTDFDKNLVLSKLRFLTDNTIVIAACLKKGCGVYMIKISLKSGTATVLKSKMVTNKFKGVTSMDIDAKNQIAALGGNENSIGLVKLNDLSMGKIFKQVHSFAITRVTFSPDSQLLASVSAANTINVIKIPSKFALSTSIWKKLWKLFVNFVLIVILSILSHYVYKYDIHNKLYVFLKDQYISRRNRNSTAADILKQTTLVGDISESISVTATGSISINTDSFSTSVISTTTSSNNIMTANQVLETIDSSLTTSTILLKSDKLDEVRAVSSSGKSAMVFDETQTVTKSGTNEQPTFNTVSIVSSTNSNPLPNTESTTISSSIEEETSMLSSSVPVFQESAVQKTIEELTFSTTEVLSPSTFNELSTSTMESMAGFDSTSTETSDLEITSSASSTPKHSIQNNEGVEENGNVDSPESGNKNEFHETNEIYDHHHHHHNEFDGNNITESMSSTNEKQMFSTERSVSLTENITLLTERTSSTTEPATPLASVWFDSVETSAFSAVVINHRTEDLSNIEDSVNTVFEEEPSSVKDLHSALEELTPVPNVSSEEAFTSSFDSTSTTLQVRGPRLADKEIASSVSEVNALEDEIISNPENSNKESETVDATFENGNAQTKSSQSLTISQPASLETMSEAYTSSVSESSAVLPPSSSKIVMVEVSKYSDTDNASSREFPSHEFLQSMVGGGVTESSILKYQSPTPTVTMVSQKAEMSDILPEEFSLLETGLQNSKENERFEIADSISSDIPEYTNRNEGKKVNSNDDYITNAIEEEVAASWLNSQNLDEVDFEGITKETQEGDFISQSVIQEDYIIDDLSETPTFNSWNEKIAKTIDAPEELPTLNVPEETMDESIHDEL